MCLPMETHSGQGNPELEGSVALSILCLRHHILVGQAAIWPPKLESEGGRSLSSSHRLVSLQHALP